MNIQTRKKPASAATLLLAFTSPSNPNQDRGQDHE